MSALLKDIESLHPSLWRGTQLARAHGRTVDTGYAALSAELSGGGWPLGTMTELLLQQPGIGEMRLLGPAMAAASGKRPITDCTDRAAADSECARLRLYGHRSRQANVAEGS